MIISYQFPDKPRAQAFQNLAKTKGLEVGLTSRYKDFHAFVVIRTATDRLKADAASQMVKGMNFAKESV